LNWGREAVALSSRHFLVAPDGSLYRLANAKFDRMLRDPNGTVLPTFAGQRVHMAELVVELAGRAALRVVRRTFAVLPFDDGGRMDSARFLKQQWARAESALDRGLDAPDSQDSQDNVVDAAVLFVAHGGAWKPARALARTLDDAALGRIACRRA
jgi:hypothetical protein